ncbi:sigma-70 family RNA polymerase sigma factor [Clostridium sp. CTA-5]
MMNCYMPLIYTIVANKISGIYSREDIEECVSDVFIDVFNNRSRIDINKGSIKAFLAVIAKRKAIDLYRKKDGKRNFHNVSIDDLFDISNDEDITNLVTKKEEHSKLIEAIKKLEQPDREIIIRKYYLNQSSKEISKAIDLKVNTIDKKASRCLQKLKKILGGVL